MLSCRRAYSRSFIPWFSARASLSSLALLLCTTLTAALATAAPTRAQVNTETLAGTVTRPGWGLAGKSSISYSSGNVNLLSARGDLQTYYATKHPDAPPELERFWFRDRILVHGSSGFTRANGNRVANDAYAHARYTRMQWLTAGAEVFAQAQNDQFRLLSRRLLMGAGLRFIFANYEWLRCWGGTGFMAEFERRAIEPEDRPPEGPDPVNMTNHRSSTYATIAVPLVPEHVEILTTVYAQPRWDDYRDTQLLNEAKLQVKVSEYLQLTTEFFLRYDSRAPRTVENVDIRISNGLAFKY